MIRRLTLSPSQTSLGISFKVFLVFWLLQFLEPILAFAVRGYTSGRSRGLPAFWVLSKQAISADIGFCSPLLAKSWRSR